MSFTFSEIKQKCKILMGMREQLIVIRDNFDEKMRAYDSLKNNIRKGSLASKYIQLELVDAIKNLEEIRLEFEKKHKEYSELKESIDPNEFLDTRYKEIKERESEIGEAFKRIDTIREECEEMDSILEEVCKEYEETKNEPDKRSKECLKRITTLENDSIKHRRFYETRIAENQRKKDEINKDLEDFFKICKELEEDPELEEGVLL
jgi:uncharacterized coiled-coil DUF342 family protein